MDNGKKVLCLNKLLYKEVKSRRDMCVNSIQKMFRCTSCLCEEDFLCQSDAAGKKELRVSWGSQNSWVCHLEKEKTALYVKKKLTRSPRKNNT